MTATVLRGDARHLPLPDASVDLIVTSPPFWALRSYTDGGVHYDGQIGAEPTPATYIATLIDCTREWMRVLKPSGSMWINLGDKYAQDTERSRNGAGNRQITQPGGLQTGAYLGGTVQLLSRDNGVPRKSLIGLPWRYAIACIDELGLILRAEVIWSKPNGLPESVTDRVRRSHETWFHLVKSPRYFSAVDAIREEHSDSKSAEAMRRWRRQVADRWTNPDRAAEGQLKGDGRTSTNFTDVPRDPNPLGKLPGSVWTVPTQPLTVPAHLGVDHFAAFPMAWPRRIVQGWSPSGICTACGQGRRPIVDKRLIVRNRNVAPIKHVQDLLNERPSDYYATTEFQGSTAATITGEACACPDTSAPTRPSVVLDPFGGTGTVAVVAHAYGRHGISVDMSADYCRLARWRTTDRGQLAAALEVEKPAVQHTGQGSLLDLFTLDGEPA